MVKKAKSEQCKGRWCKIHTFSIKPYMMKHSHSKQETISFCPKFNNPKKLFEKALPQLNLDKKCYTPLFVLHQDRRLYADYDCRGRQAFQSNKTLEQYEISQIMVPKVSNEKPYCKVCKMDFPDYLEVNYHVTQHIESAVHRNCIRKNMFSDLIVDLQQIFKLQKQEQNQKVDNKIMMRQDTDLADVESEIQVLSRSIIIDKQMVDEINQSSMERPLLQK